MDKKYIMCDFQLKPKMTDISTTISDLSDGWIAKENEVHIINSYFKRINIICIVFSSLQ